MSKIKSRHLFSVCALVWAFITIEAAVNEKYLLASLNFLAFLANGIAAIKFRQWGN